MTETPRSTDTRDTRAPRDTRTTRAPRATRDRGQVSLEFLGFLPILLAVALAVIQLGIAAYTVQQAGTAARAAARADTRDGFLKSCEAAAYAAVSDYVRDGMRPASCDRGLDRTSATVTVTIPSIIPGVGFGTTTKTAVMPKSER
ncbi:TadE family protein [Streptomyces polyrhachis]|uniref:TadE family protein n=1 Tax=Streptomyces polyrhachis TaxID=1282885 RepID=A0ABW2G961_9ACTN